MEKEDPKQRGKQIQSRSGCNLEFWRKRNQCTGGVLSKGSRDWCEHEAWFWILWLRKLLKNFRKTTGMVALPCFKDNSSYWEENALNKMVKWKQKPVKSYFSRPHEIMATETRLVEMRTKKRTTQIFWRPRKPGDGSGIVDKGKHKF